MKKWLSRAAVAVATALVGTTLVAPTARAGWDAWEDWFPECEFTSDLTVLNFNDFHGRISGKGPDTSMFFASLEAEKEKAGDWNTIALSAGDNIGASLFPSFIKQDTPTLQILNEAQVAASALGNHEFDRGYPDFKDRVAHEADFPHLAANVYDKATGKPVMAEYTLILRAGLRIAVIGAVTSHLPELSSPETLAGLEVGDPVAAVNRVANEITQLGFADVIIAEYHEGAVTTSSLENALASDAEFAHIVNNTSPEVAAIFNGHTHGSYAWNAPIPGTDRTRPVVQAGSYGSAYGKVTISVDAFTSHICNTTAEIKKPVVVVDDDARKTFIQKYPRAVEVDRIVTTTLAEAATVGAEKVATASAPITRALPGGKEDRGRESTMSNMVAQMFYDQLSAGDKNFIGVQNPGGTRADFAPGDISYAQAASILPFANTLMTTQLTGAQVKTMLEQQWQPATSSRPFLGLGLSANVTYAYDEARPVGNRITSIMINGAPIDVATTYTVGSGSFLIAGGDNFTVLSQGKNTKDTGRADLQSWVDWLKAKQTVSPSFARRGVSISGDALKPGTTATLKIGVPQSIAKDTLDLTSTGAPANTTLVASLGDTKLGEATVAGGSATITVAVPDDAKGILVLTAQPSGTVLMLPIDSR